MSLALWGLWRKSLALRACEEGCRGAAITNPGWNVSRPTPFREPPPRQHADLPPLRDADAAGEHVVVAGLDLVQQTAVRPAHHAEDRRAVRGEHPGERFAAAVVVARAGDLEPHQLGERRAAPRL